MSIMINDLTHVSTKQLWRVSFPLMISFMSTFVMLFVDRIFLAYYDQEALNAAAMSGTLAWSFIVAWLTLGSLTEVFVSQYNGAKRYLEMGQPVWQMIWFVVPAIFFFAFSGLFLSEMIYPGVEATYQRDYFTWLMPCGPFALALSSLSAFYIGRGRGKIVKWLSILGNVINVGLDPILIFGVKGFIPSMGVKGAAIATVLGYIVQTVVIFGFFLSKRNKERYGTHDFTLRPSLLKQCLKIALPPSVFSGFEVLAWAVFYSMMAKAGPSHIFVCSVSQSIEMLFLFFCFGLEKGVAAIAGNLIGAGKQELLKKLIVSAFKLIGFFAIFLSIFTIIYPDPLIDLFMNQQSGEGVLAIDHRSTIKTSLIFLGLYIVIESVRWLYSGILTAAGDTFFLMLIGTLSIWIFLLVPTYFIILQGKQSILFAFVIWVAFSIISTSLIYLRFRNGAWKSKAILVKENPPVSAGE